MDLDVLDLLAAVNFKILKKTDETVLHANLFYNHNLTSQPVCALVASLTHKHDVFVLEQ